MYDIILHAAIFVLGVVCFILYNKLQSMTNKYYQLKLWLDHILVIRNGGNWLYGNYYLVSFDAGKTWYTADKTDEDCIKTKYGYVAQWGWCNLKLADQETIDKTKLKLNITIG